MHEKLKNSDEFGGSLMGLLVAIGLVSIGLAAALGVFSEKNKSTRSTEKSLDRYTIGASIVAKTSCSKTDIASQTCDGTTLINLRDKSSGIVISNSGTTIFQGYQVKATCLESITIVGRKKTSTTAPFKNLVSSKELLCFDVASTTSDTVISKEKTASEAGNCSDKKKVATAVSQCPKGYRVIGGEANCQTDNGGYVIHSRSNLSSNSWEVSCCVADKLSSSIKKPSGTAVCYKTNDDGGLENP